MGTTVLFEQASILGAKTDAFGHAHPARLAAAGDVEGGAVVYRVVTQHQQWTASAPTTATGL